MDTYQIYNNDRLVACFELSYVRITRFTPIIPELLPMQIRKGGAETFALWLQNRAIDLNTFQHRTLMKQLLGTRDKIRITILTHMFSISDSFTCFPEGQFQRRLSVCTPEEQDRVSDFILLSNHPSLPNAMIATPNASTDGSFTKTWKYEDGAWWLVKLQSEEAVRSECEIGRALAAFHWDTAEYRYAGSGYTSIRSLIFVHENEFYEPYESFRFAFAEHGDEYLSDEDEIVLGNLSSQGPGFREAWMRILAADSLFMNTDRHMRNFGVIRISETGEVLRLAPSFDNNRACLANPGGRYGDVMLRFFLDVYGDEPKKALADLVEACLAVPYLSQAVKVGKACLSTQRSTFRL